MATQSDSELHEQRPVIKSVTQARFLPDFAHKLAKELFDADNVWLAQRLSKAVSDTEPSKNAKG